MPRKKGSSSVPANSNMTMTGAMAERVATDGRRKLSLTIAERKALGKRQRVELAVALFLDLQNSHSWPEMAEELGITVRMLKTLVKDPEFIELYNEHFVELGHDPRLQAVRGSLTSMLPRAVNKLAAMIDSDRISDRDSLAAIKEVLRLNGVEGAKPIENDKNQLVEFLAKAGVNIENFNIVVPKDYADAMRDVVDGEVLPAKFVEENLV